MRYWTAHLHPDNEPILIPEGFSWGALVFGPFWLAAHRSWIAAIIVLAAEVLISALVQDSIGIALATGIAVLLGLSGHDLRRWSMENRGYLLTHVVLARNEAEALLRLLAGRPDLAGRFMPPEAAR